MKSWKRKKERQAEKEREINEIHQEALFILGLQTSYPTLGVAGWSDPEPRQQPQHLALSPTPMLCLVQSRVLLSVFTHWNLLQSLDLGLLWKRVKGVGNRGSACPWAQAATSSAACSVWGSTVSSSPLYWTTCSHISSPYWPASNDNNGTECTCI